jgi:hypothetical protein
LATLKPGSGDESAHHHVVHRSLNAAAGRPGIAGVTATLGRLVSVPLRDVWEHEANDFTPWLAEVENLSLLAETLHLGDLRVQGTEVPVGNFFIDILARDVDGRVVVIENQFGFTDHTHLGQIMTYLAGQEGRATVIWIAEAFREEHRAAIDWLNASTIQDFDFFAVEVEALRIGVSQPAPRFNVVAKPNDWSRGIGRATRAASAGPPDEQQKAYIAYWSRFGTFLANKHAPFKPPDPVPRGEWCGFGRLVPRGYTLFAAASLVGQRRTVAIYIGHRGGILEFDALVAAKDSIEAEFGAPLEWRRNPKTAQIEANRPDLAEKNETEQFEWFLDQMERFSRVFRDRITALPLENSADADLALEL